MAHVELTETASKVWAPGGSASAVGLQITTAETNINYGGPSANYVACNSSGIQLNASAGIAINNLINYGVAKIANGGGSAPTLGTIGGTGPATAAQSGWMKIQIAGTNYFIPVWT